MSPKDRVMVVLDRVGWTIMIMATWVGINLIVGVFTVFFGGFPTLWSVESLEQAGHVVFYCVIWATIPYLIFCFSTCWNTRLIEAIVTYLLFGLLGGVGAVVAELVCLGGLSLFGQIDHVRNVQPAAAQMVALIAVTAGGFGFVADLLFWSAPKIKEKEA